MSIGGREQRTSIATFNVTTKKTTTILNNYYGVLMVQRPGRYASPTPNCNLPLPPSTGAVTVVDDSMVQTNGIAVSPDEKTLYIAESGAVSGTWDYNLTTIHGSRFNHTAKRGVYAFTINDAPNESGRYLTNRHLIYLI
ncbi:hypothetical protein W97_01918 [Coniosporium apollinis CBS 100218]|uniref:SMP-30/Gluconolactonase/LRE-like region domain-containing protein n=1 Tax=Coniosporium apollinis (strain CBS 100218) TaxID=1168221 RepID=R7YLL2_CONA1|nr:uncharacterized protein W97_01918 [Coniosporium apollinis CBS 100218]EON62694.1 hypothetical protein W97_01918 [Coniosporium apollinis CBS 100218]